MIEGKRDLMVGKLIFGKSPICAWLVLQKSPANSEQECYRVHIADIGPF